MSIPEVLTVRQAAEALQVSNKSVYKLVKSELIGAVRVGRTIRIPKIELERFTHANCS